MADAVLPANAFCVSVMHMVNPATFWVTEPLGQHMSKERGKLAYLEEILSAHCHHSHDGVNYMPEEEEMVSVQHPETGRWHRAQVEYILHEVKGYMYKVFLVDYGLSIKVPSSAFRKLPSAWDNLDYQSFQVVLYGVFPTTVEMDYNDMKMKRRVASNWTPAAWSFVKQVLEKATNFWLVYKKNIEKKIYGDLFVEVEKESFSLTNELCTKEYAVFSEELFEKELEKYDMQTPSPQRPTCLEDIKNRSTSHIPTSADTSNIRHSQDCGENFQNCHERPHDYGMVQGRRRITPDVQQGEKCNENRRLEASNENEMMSSMLGLLDLLDYQPNHDTKSLSEMCTAQKSPQDGKNSSSINYFPAGASLKDYNRKLKSPAVINSTSLIDKRRHTSGPYSVQFKDATQFGSALGMALPARTATPLDKKINKMQSSAAKRSGQFEQSAGEEQCRSLSLLECLQGKMNSVSENGTERNSGMQQGVKAEEITSISTRNCFQDIVNSVAISAKTNRKDMFGDTPSQSSIPDVKAVLPQATPKQLETPGNDKRAKSVNSLASVKDAVATSTQIPAVHSITEHFKASRILVRGEIGFRAIQSVVEANFPSEIHQALAEMGISNPMRIQTYAWPAIMHGHYTVLVSPPQSGKTLSYIVPLVSFMLTQDAYSELRPGNGPLVLVLCSGSKKAQFIYKQCCRLLKFTVENKVRVQIAYGAGREEELQASLANGCDILISTPHCFMRLMGCSRLFTNVDRLAHLVLDEVDILADKFLSEVKGLIAECKQMLVRRAKCGIPVQVIAASEKWCPAVEQFSQHISQNFLVCISGYLEAAVYAKLQPTLHYLGASSKPQAVLDILDGYHGQYKTVIMCHSVADVEEVVPFLKSHCFQVLVAHEDMTRCHNNEISHYWKCALVPGALPILVCTDDVLPELDVSDAMWLIHYSLPRTKTGFGFRFSCLMNNYPNMFDKSVCKEDSPGECKVHIFAERDQNSRELPEVVHFLKRLSVPIDPDIEAKATEIVLQKECEKLSLPLCYYLKAFGECMERRACSNRHIIVDATDRPSYLPVSGEVKVKILHVHNASNFSARLLEHIDVSGRTVAVPDEYLTVNMAVYSHYSPEKNRLLHGIPDLGDICSVESKINIFQRVQVVDIVKEDKRGIPEEVAVKFLDEGTFSVVKVYQLLALPEELQRLPHQAVDIFLCNVKPCDLDSDWSEIASSSMNEWINDINSGETDAKFLVGKVMLSAGYTLWLEPLEYRNYLSSLNTHVVELSLSKELIKCKFGVSNPGHLKKLYELCLAGGLEVPSYEKEVRNLEKVGCKMKTLPSPQWAHLDTEEFQEVVFVCADNPHQFFVRHYKFNDIFERFIDELQKCVKTKPNNFHLEKGSYCLGKFPDDGMWYRAQITQLLGNDCATLFFVDHGDKASVSLQDIAPITEMQITKLPFQAMECSLAGIEPPDGGTWSEEATDVIYEFCDNSYGLYVKVCEVMLAALCTGGSKYKVVLVDNTSTNMDVYLNSVLVERNLALSESIEQILETMDPVCLEGADISEESDVEPEKTRVVKLSDIVSQRPQPNSALPSVDDSVSDDEEYDILVHDPLEFLMIRVNTRHEPSPPAFPSSDDNLKGAAASCISFQHHLSNDDIDDMDCIPPLVRTTRTAQVLWHQDECVIYIKIMLTGVQKYYIGWDVMHLQLSTQMNSELYEVMLDLYSAINVSSITHTAKGFFVYIKLMKTVTGFYWPRLLHSQFKQPWLKLDLEKYEGDFDSDEDNAKTRCDRALKQLASSDKQSQIPAPNLKDEAVISNVPISSSDDDDDTDDEKNLQDESYDPFDPLN